MWKEYTGRSKHPLPTTRETILHMDVTRWSIPKSDGLHSLQPKIEKLYTVSTEKAMVPHSSTLAWRIAWTEEPGRLQSMGSLRVGHDWATSLSLFTFMHWRRQWQPTPVFLPGESQGLGAWWAAVYGVARSRTRLKWLSSSLNWFIYATMSQKHFPTLIWGQWSDNNRDSNNSSTP